MEHKKTTRISAGCWYVVLDKEKRGRKKNRCDVTTTRVEKEQHGKIERAALQRFLTLAHLRYEGLPLELMKEME